MRAVVITRPGGPEVLEIRDVPAPTPGAEQVLVRVEAAALNRADLLQREGRYPAPPGSPPDIPGLEFSGTVVERGAGAVLWSAGDRVFGIVGGGAQAEYVVVHERMLAAVPESLDPLRAAAIPEAFITADDALFGQAGLCMSERVLIHAVGSGVGLAAMQLARAAGAVPFGTARTADKIARAREFGLEDGVVAGDDPQQMVAAAQRWTANAGMDVVLDLVGGPYLPVSIRAAAARGRVILLATMGGDSALVPMGLLLGKRLTVRGTVLRSRPLEEKILATRAFVARVVPLLAQGTARPVVDRVFALDAIADAHRYLASNASFGKVVVQVAGP